MAEIDTEIDGFFCRDCQCMHPVLMWHDKYDDYLPDRKMGWERAKKHWASLFSDAKYQDVLPAKGLMECAPTKCCVCGAPTSFCLIDTGKPVCSDECKYTFLPLLKYPL